jgi:hypothetical protein
MCRIQNNYFSFLKRMPSINMNKISDEDLIDEDEFEIDYEAIRV